MSILSAVIVTSAFSLAKADDSDLWITEVDPATGEVEITNVGSDPFTLDSNYPFCHRFNYSNVIPSGTTFAAGESQVFTLAGLDAGDSDLWLYRRTGFGNAANMISGLKWGAQANVGRTGVASGGDLWDGIASSVPSPPAGQSLQLTGPDPFRATNWTVGTPDLGSFDPPMSPVTVRVTITNLAPENGNFLTPAWVGFHDGGFDSYDGGSPSSPGIERIAEDGNPAVLSGEFLASGAGTVDGVLNGVGPIAPSASVSRIFTVDANSIESRYFSYASMIIPSNDAYVANGNPTAHAIFDGEGNFVGVDFDILGSEVNDAGTEVNDELPANTAFFGQSAPDTGTPEGGVNTPHPGFNAPGSGGILDDPRFANADFTGAGYQIANVKVELVEPEPINLRVTVTNLAPENGNFLTPAWVGFHDGGFDSYDGGSPSSPGIERIAEDGNPSVLSGEFLSSGAGTVDAVLNGIGPIAPGASVSRIITVDANSVASRYFSYASMIIPSNDAYVANGNPMAHAVFDSAGNFVGADFEILGNEVNDAGTEVNDELPANTAFFGQAAPDTGTTEGGVNTPHPGFNAPGSGGILDDPRFANADFTTGGYQIANVKVERVQPNPVEVTLTIMNDSPENGVFLTPVWVGFHDGSFDVFSQGEAVSAELERLAEDGNTAPLSGAFQASDGTGTDRTIVSGGEIPPFAPGESTTATFVLDANDPNNRYLSFASMVIPSNDAFIANSDPKTYPIFDEAGNFVGSSILRLGSQVYDAGTEVNDELAANTAFFGQASPDTGVDENGVAAIHQGFNAPGSGGILDDPRFSAADFTADGFRLFSLDVFRPISIASLNLVGDRFEVEWQGGEAPYQVQWSPDLQEGNWNNVGEPTADTSASFSVSGDRVFVRVLSGYAPQPQTVQYDVIFDATWSAATHPNFPGGAHFSGLIGATHTSDVTFWAPGQLASPGIERMAETGGKSPLTSEVNAAITAGSAENLLSGGGIGTSPGSVTLRFSASQDSPLLTLVSMIAPSPDWFVGVHGLNLFQDGRWVDDLTVDLDPYDAGTDDGANFTSPNADSSPKQPIFRITGFPLEQDGSVAPFGTFRLMRVE